MLYVLHVDDLTFAASLLPLPIKSCLKWCSIQSAVMLQSTCLSKYIDTRFQIENNMRVFFGGTDSELRTEVPRVSEQKFGAVKVILCSVNTTQFFRGEVTLYSRNRDSLSFEVQDLSLPRFNVNHFCFLGTDQMASWSEGLLMFCSVLCLMYLWRSVLTGLCSPRRDRQPEQQPRWPAGQRWAHLQLGAQPPGRDVQRLGSFFAPLYCFVFVSSMSIWHSLTCIGHIYQFQNVCFFSYDLYTSIKTSACVCDRNR